MPVEDWVLVVQEHVLEQLIVVLLEASARVLCLVKLSLPEESRLLGPVRVGSLAAHAEQVDVAGSAKDRDSEPEDEGL